MKQTSLPPIFSQYADRVRFIQQASPTEWSSSCPKCGGDVHQDHSWPDRCRWFTSGKPLGWCRRCGGLFWPDQAEGYTPPSPDDLAKWRREQEQREHDRKRSAERALAHLREGHIWQRYHDAMDAYARTYWQKRGIPPSFQDWWQLGWCEDFTFLHHGDVYHQPSATIPLFGQAWQPLNIKHRIVTPPDPADKYRYEISGQGASPLFLADPDKEVGGHAIIVEGEIKAAVVAVTLDTPPESVAGLPGITPDTGILAPFAKCERVTFVLDPGVTIGQVKRLCAAVGPAECRVLVTAQKIDDAILATGMAKQALRSLLRNAKPMGVKA